MIYNQYAKCVNENIIIYSVYNAELNCEQILMAGAVR
jgi:hypothetical protein